MASKPKAPAAAETAAPKSSKKLIIIIVALLLVLGIGGGAAYFLLKPGAESSEGEEKHATKKKAKKKHAEKVTFMPLDSMTLNLSGAETNFIQLTMSLAITDPKAEEAIKERSPKIKNKMLLIITQKTAKELLTPAGKEDLAKELLEGIRESIPEEVQDGVNEVLLTSFIVQ